MPVRTPFGGSRFVRWTLGPAIAAVAVGLVAGTDRLTPAVAAVVTALLLLALAVAAPVRFAWAGRTVAALVFLAYAGYVVTELRALAGVGLSFAALRSPALALVGLFVLGVPALAWALRGGADDAVPLSGDDPLLADAVRRARASIPELRRLRAEDAGPAAVKWAFTTDAGEVEHVWGAVLALHLEEVVVRMLSRPVTQHARVPGPITIPLAAVEDWQVTLRDGAVRGSFSTAAMIAACRRDGRPVPRALRSVRLLDAEEPTAIARGAVS